METVWTYRAQSIDTNTKQSQLYQSLLKRLMQ